MTRTMRRVFFLALMALAERELDDEALGVQEEVVQKKAKKRTQGDDAAAALEQLMGPKHDGKYFVFLEVYALEGTASEWKNSVASTGKMSKAASQYSRGKLKNENRNVGTETGLMQVSEGSDATAMAETKKFYHSEVVFCDRSLMSEMSVTYFEEKLKDANQYAEISPDVWKYKHFQCETLSYGGSDWAGSCSGVYRYSQKLSQKRAGISSADTDDTVYKYIYGSTDFSASDIEEQACAGKCGMDWSGEAYNAITRNCNFFSSTVLMCHLGLSDSTPNLHFSDMRATRCFQCAEFPNRQYVKVITPFNSANRVDEGQTEQTIEKDAYGKVFKVDHEGDPKIRFYTTGRYLGEHWVLKQDWGSLEKTYISGDPVVVTGPVASFNEGNLTTPLIGLKGHVKKDEGKNVLVTFITKAKQKVHWIRESDRVYLTRNTYADGLE